MDNPTVQVLLWIGAGICLVLYLMRRRKRKLSE